MTPKCARRPAPRQASQLEEGILHGIWSCIHPARTTALCLALALAGATCDPGQPEELAETEEPAPPQETLLAPDGLQVRPLGVRGAEVAWHDRSDGTAWFAVERSDPGEDGWTQVGIRPPGVFTWKDWGLDPDSAYAYRVSAATLASRSPPSPSAEVRTLPTEIVDPVVTVHDPRAVQPGLTLLNVADPWQVMGLAAVIAVDESGQVVWHYESRMKMVSETDVFPDGDILMQVGFTTLQVSPSGDPVQWLEQVFVHHDVDPLPWGNLVAITSPSIGPYTQWEIDPGSPDPDDRAIEWIIEIDPRTTKIVNLVSWNERVPREHACNACLQWYLFNKADWLHLNAVEYDLEDEALYLSVRNLNRVYKLSYPDGDVEWILGDGGDFGEGLFDHQHNPSILVKPSVMGPGRMLLFDNGLHSGAFTPQRSRAIEIEFDPEAAEARIVWEWDGPPAFFSDVMGHAQRLENGNTLVTDSMGHTVTEVSPDGLPVWELWLPPPYFCYKAHRIDGFL